MVGRTLHVEARIRQGDFVLQVALDVAAGSTVVVIGPNGAGKTTLLRAVAGLAPLDGGVITYAGTAWDDPATGTYLEPTRRRCPVVFQDYRLFPHLSVLDNVAYPLRVRGDSRRQARSDARQTLARHGLAELAGRRPGQLSGGQAQRVAVARALAGAPAVLLLDEPLAALDARTRQSTRVELRQALAAFDGPALLVTHDPLEALTLADHLVVLEHGEVVQAGAPREVAARPATEYIARLVGVNLYAGAVTPEGTIRLDTGETLRAIVDPQSERLRPHDRALVALSPSAISIHLRRPDGVSARNVWSATIRGVEHLRDRIRIDLDGRPPAIADITPAAFAQLGLDLGAPVWLSAKATEVLAYRSDAAQRDRPAPRRTVTRERDGSPGSTP